MRRVSRIGATLSATVLVALCLHAALAAANVVPGSRAGTGSRAVSGYGVTLVRYTLATGDPTRLGTVRFRLNRAAREAFARFPAANPTWTKCTLAGVNATCTLTVAVPVSAAASLEVAAGS